MRELSPFYIPFIPSKCYASLLPSYAYLLMVCCASIVVWDQTTIGLHRLPISLHNRQLSYSPFIPPPSGPLPRSIPSFFPREIAQLPQENEIFFALCNSLAYGEMNATQRAVLGNILR